MVPETVQAKRLDTGIVCFQRLGRRRDICGIPVITSIIATALDAGADFSTVEKCIVLLEERMRVHGCDTCTRMEIARGDNDMILIVIYLPIDIDVRVFDIIIKDFAHILVVTGMFSKPETKCLGPNLDLTHSFKPLTRM